MDALSTIKTAGLALKGYDALKNWLDERRQRRLEEWNRRVFTHPCWDTTPEIVQAEIQRALEEDKDEARRELIWATAKELVDCVSDAALPAIASLTAETLHGRRPMDTFYRGAVRMLADLSVVEVGHFRDLLALVLGAIDGATNEVRITFAPPNKLLVTVLASDGTSGSDTDRKPVQSTVEFDAIRLVALLKERHIGYQLAPIYGRNASVDLKASAVRDLARHLTASAA